MKRLEQTIASKLSIGDRFYKVSDKGKTVLQMVEFGVKHTKYQTYKYWCCNALVLDNPGLTNEFKERQYSAIKAETPVVFLRNINQNI